jgi:hypothetical protein
LIRPVNVSAAVAPRDDVLASSSDVQQQRLRLGLATLHCRCHADGWVLLELRMTPPPVTRN